VVVLKLIRLITTFIFFLLACRLQAEVVPEKGAVLRKIEFQQESARKRFGTNFTEFVGKPYDNLAIKIKNDAIVKELFNSGYFNAVLKTELVGTERDPILKIDLLTNSRVNLSFRGNKVFSHHELRNKLLEKIKNDFGKNDINELASYLTDVYEIGGFYNTHVIAYQNQGKDQEQQMVRNYFFEIKEGTKVKIKEVTFRGNSSIKSPDLLNVFKKNASALAEGGFYDKVFFDDFTNVLKKEYFSRGFVYAEISKPRVISNEDEKSLTIEYGISEKQQIVLKDIYFKNVPEDLQAGARASLINHEGSPINIVEIENDLRKSIVHFQNEGYYFASIANINGVGLLTYNLSDSTAELSPEIILDRKICFNEVKVNGIVKTLPEVIDREIHLEKGELITPDKLDGIRKRLSETGLFATLRITPYMMYESEEVSCPKTNLVVQVKERDFGQVEIAGGYRTDLGIKLSSDVTYNNLFGTNKGVSLRAQGNQRFNLDGFDERRKSEDKQFPEYLVKASFLDPYLFYDVIHTQLEFELSTSVQRSRYSGFDADIFRISPQILKSFPEYNFGIGLNYQFEKINTFDATLEKDTANYYIGSITPSATLDYRNDPVYTRKGTHHAISSEWANPYFGSINEPNYEVNFLKLVNRNKFYYPMADVTLAVSLALGYEKNFATEIIGNDASGQPVTKGYIPSIRVFRLDGPDEVRGYDPGEINRLKDGTPIGEVIVQDTAYFNVLKFEPRYNVNDYLQLVAFFDAGRVFVNEFEPFDLRTSAGVGFKILTQVGSFDFNYGIKLQRQSYPDGSHDSPSRFSVSIGFF
jgi:outer membrane protein insertion porin family